MNILGFKNGAIGHSRLRLVLKSAPFYDFQAIIVYDDLTVHPVECPLDPSKEVLCSKYPLNYPPILLLPPIVSKKPLGPGKLGS